MTALAKHCANCGREGTRGFALSDDEAVLLCVDRSACLARARKSARLANAGRCCDCVVEGVTTERKLATKKGSDELEPGPRCVTHHRAVTKARKLAAHGKRTESTYGITAEDYWGIYQFQGGRCALCQLATGKARRLAVDHDHDLAKLHDHPVDQGCRLCVRGLLCKRCNRFGVPLIFAVIQRAIVYLVNPPARQYFESVS